MIRVEKMTLDPITGTALADLLADSRSEVTSGATIEGLPEGYTLAMGSSVFTTDSEIAFMKSDGTWNWG